MKVPVEFLDAVVSHLAVVDIVISSGSAGMPPGPTGIRDALPAPGPAHALPRSAWLHAEKRGPSAVW